MWRAPILILAYASLTCCIVLQAQTPVPGPNVNMVSGRQWPGGDPFLQRQNEPSIAVSTRNPQHLLAGANDYRSVDIPFPQDDGRVIGDAWLGVFKSLDGGQTWRSALLPGFPQDQSPESQSSPLRNFQVATDPLVRAGTDGLFYYSGLVFARGNNAGSGVFVARFRDRNDREYNDPFEYLGATIVDAGTSGVFLDKPWLVVDIPRNGATCGNVGLTYSVFTGTDPKPDNNPRSKIMFVRSTNCGATWDRPLKLSETFSLNQGTTMAIDPISGAIYVAWRQMKSQSQSDGFVVARSTDGGLTFGSVVQAFTFADGVLFDQGSTPTSFRTLALPSLAVDSSGRVYIVWPQRGIGPNGEARIMLASSTDGTTWTTPQPVDDRGQPGHQFMPALTFAAGKLTLAFYDTREDHTKGALVNGIETRQWMGDSAAAVFNGGISDVGLTFRHTIDVRVAQASPGSAFGPSVRVSQYKFGSRPLPPGTPPRPRVVEQLQFNPPNLPMFVQGTTPFIGDYIDLAALAFVVDALGNWAYNTSPSGPSALHVVWTDNRDVRTPPIDPATGKPNWKLYTPPNAPPGTPAGTYDPNTPRPACVAAQTGSRNQNIYTSRITTGLYVALGGNSKQLSSSMQRGFPVIVRNNTQVTKHYRLAIVNQPAGGQASFLQTSLLTQVDVSIPARSSISRTVWVTSTGRRARVTVDVKELDKQPDGSFVLNPNGLQASVVTNPDISNPDITNPDIANPDITNPDITNPDITNPDITSAEVYNPAVSNPDITNPDISNPDITNPDISNPDITNPDIANPDISTMVVANPDIINPDISNPDITNPDIANPDITNPDIAALPSNATDLTWKLTNTGNTSASYNAKLFLKKASFCCPRDCEGPPNTCPASCYKCQLILRRIYPTPVASGCTLAVETQNVAVANILNPAFATPGNVSNPDIINPDITNATVSLSPGEGARVTLRVFGVKLPETTQPPAAKPVGVATGLNTNGTRGASLTITTLVLPVAVAGNLYGVDLQSLGGKCSTRTWTRLSGSLPSGLPPLDSAGRISGTPTVTGTYEFTVQVQDSPTAPTLPQIDKQDLTIEVNRLSITGVSAFQVGRPGDTILKEGESVTVKVMVGNDGPATATAVTPVPTATGTGTVAASCGAPSPAPATMLGNTSQEFTYTCGPVTGEGALTFSLQASGQYVNSAATVTATAGPVLSNSVVVDKTPPVITGAQEPAANVAGWNNTDVAVIFTCTDALSGVDVPPLSPQVVSSEGAGQSRSATCTDKAGNSASATVSGINIDKTAPVVTGSRAPGPNAAGWNNTDVTVTFSCTDALSGVAQLSSPQVVQLEGAAQSRTGTCTDKAGNSASATVSGINIDKTPPTISFITPPKDSPYLLKATVTSGYSCADALSLVNSCVGAASVDTSTPGLKTFTVTASDRAGNSTAGVQSYVVKYQFTGFLSPLAAAGTPENPSDSGTATFGNAVPLKWQLKDAAGAFLSSLATLETLVAIRNPDCAGSAEGPSFMLYNPTTGATGGSVFRYDSKTKQFIFNWATGFVQEKGCYHVVVTLNDTVSYATKIRLQ